MSEKQKSIPGSIKVFFISFVAMVSIGSIENDLLMGLQIGIGLICFASVIYMWIEALFTNGWEDE